MNQNYISAMVLCRDGIAGTFKVSINEQGELVSTAPDWQPESPRTRRRRKLELCRRSRGVPVSDM